MKLLAVVGRCSDLGAVLKFMQLVGANRPHIAVVVLCKRSHHFRTKHGIVCLTREEDGQRLFTLTVDSEDAAWRMHKLLTDSMVVNSFRDVRMVTS